MRAGMDSGAALVSSSWACCRVASRNFVTGCLIRDVTEPDVWLSPDLVVNRKAEGEEAMLTQVGAGNISAEAMTPAG
jgi:hypothetical protein